MVYWAKIFFIEVHKIVAPVWMRAHPKWSQWATNDRVYTWMMVIFSGFYAWKHILHWDFWLWHWQDPAQNKNTLSKTQSVLVSMFRIIAFLSAPPPPLLQKEKQDNKKLRTIQMNYAMHVDICFLFQTDSRFSRRKSVVFIHTRWL